MRCPQCVQEDQTSRCFKGNRTVTTAMAGVQRYWDEAGVYHSHDPNRSTSTFHCSRGHRWTITTRQQCPACSFGKEEPLVKISTSSGV